MKDYDIEDVRKSVSYHYAQVKSAIEHDWTADEIPVSSLDKQFLRLSEDTIDDGCLMNETVLISNDGPELENNLESVPPRFERQLNFQQLLQSRIWKCKFSLKNKNFDKNEIQTCD